MNRVRAKDLDHLIATLNVLHRVEYLATSVILGRGGVSEQREYMELLVFLLGGHVPGKMGMGALKHD